MLLIFSAIFAILSVVFFYLSKKYSFTKAIPSFIAISAIVLAVIGIWNCNSKSENIVTSKIENKITSTVNLEPRDSIESDNKKSEGKYIQFTNLVNGSYNNRISTNLKVEYYYYGKDGTKKQGSVAASSIKMCELNIGETPRMDTVVIRKITTTYNPKNEKKKVFKEIIDKQYYFYVPKGELPKEYKKDY